MQNQLLNLYQQYCSYKITDGIQKLNIKLDYPRIYKEVTSFILQNKFGFSSISLRLPQPSQNNQDYAAKIEDVRYTAVQVDQFEYINKTVNPHADSEYKCWHPDLENSYIKELSNTLEEYSGLSIGRVRLAWLHPWEGYPMHIDMEPLRFHIPIITNKYCYFVENNNLYYMPPGNIYHLATTSTHMARNFGKLPRLHLIYSTHFSDEFDTAIKQIFTDAKIQDLFFEHLDDLDSEVLKFLTTCSAVSASEESSYISKNIIKRLLNYRSSK